MSDTDQYLTAVFEGRKGVIIGGYKRDGRFVEIDTPFIDSVTAGWEYICPMLRKTDNPRKQWNGLWTRWLWADVDWQKVPTNERGVVRRRIRMLGAMLVASGSVVDRLPNVHVYVKLTKRVDVKDHYLLNRALAQYLHADAKFNDNALLRLPGTRSSKTNRLVRIIGGHGKAVSPERLQKHLPQVNVMAHTGPSTWRTVDVSHVPNRLLRMCRMPVDEALGRFGRDRSKACYGVTRELMKAGLTANEIHTLMDDFPAAREIQDDRGWDVHEDVDRILAKLRGSV